MVLPQSHEFTSDVGISLPLTANDWENEFVNFRAHPESKLQEAALFVVCNLVWRGEGGAGARQARLSELGVVRALRLLLRRRDAQHLHDKVRTALSQFNDYT